MKRATLLASVAALAAAPAFADSHDGENGGQAAMQEQNGEAQTSEQQTDMASGQDDQETGMMSGEDGEQSDMASGQDDETDMAADGGGATEDNGVVAMDEHASGITSGEMTTNMLRTSEIIGGDVYAVEQEWSDDEWAASGVFDTIQDGWQDVGNISDVVLSKDGAAVGLIIEHGGFLDIGDDNVLLSMEDVRRIETGGGDIDYVTNMTESSIEGMPEVEENWF